MYNKSGLLGALHVKSKKYLTVDLDKGVISIHRKKDSPDKHDKQHEIKFSDIQRVKSDVSRSVNNKCFLTIFTVDGEVRFKFKHCHDFHEVSDILASISTSTAGPLHDRGEEYSSWKAAYLNSRQPESHLQRLNSLSSVSSDEQHEYALEDEIEDRIIEKTKGQLDIPIEPHIETKTTPH